MSSTVKEQTLLEKEVDRAIGDLRNHTVGSDDYMRSLDAVVKLHKLKVEEKPSAISKDTLALIGANLLGILLIIRHEHVNVITSRAMNIVPRLR